MRNMRPGGALANAFRFPANPANTNVVYHGKTALALWEGGKPFEFDPKTLETLGEYSFNGDLGGTSTYSAHGKTNRATGEYLNFGVNVVGISFKGPKCCLSLYKISPSGKMIQTHSHPVQGFPFIHDFAITENYCVFFVSSVEYDEFWSTTFGLKPMVDGMHFDENMPCRVLVFDQKSFNLVKEFELDPQVVVHFGNAYEDGDYIHVDAISTFDFGRNEALGDIHSDDVKFEGGVYWRFRLNMRDGTTSGQRRSDDSYECEFPTWDFRYSGQKTSLLLAAASVENGTTNFFNTIQHVDLEKEEVTLLNLGVGRFTGEPVFVPRSSHAPEGDGYILAMIVDTLKQSNEIVIFDAKDIHSAIATVKLAHNIPQGFHGQFYNECFI